jgi:hypothetical protein
MKHVLAGKLHRIHGGHSQLVTIDNDHTVSHHYRAGIYTKDYFLGM